MRCQVSDQCLLHAVKAHMDMHGLRGFRHLITGGWKRLMSFCLSLSLHGNSLNVGVT